MIDILLSTYNGGSFLREQLDSILRQTHQNWKLLIRDDGSTDDTLKIIAEYCQKHPLKIMQLTDPLGNLGCLRSFEVLLQNSSSEYIMFCDQDDVWLNNKVAIAFNTIQKVEDKSVPCIVCSDLCVVDKELSVIAPSYWSYVRIRPSLLQNADKLAVNNYVTGCTMIFNNAAKIVSLPFGLNAILHDAWIALRVAKQRGTIIALQETPILYRQHLKNGVGAIHVKYNIRYFATKLIHSITLIENTIKNYKQANEAIGISLTRFLFNRLLYLIKR